MRALEAGPECGLRIGEAQTWRRRAETHKLRKGDGKPRERCAWPPLGIADGGRRKAEKMD